MATQNTFRFHQAENGEYSPANRNAELALDMINRESGNNATTVSSYTLQLICELFNGNVEKVDVEWCIIVVVDSWDNPLATFRNRDDAHEICKLWNDKCGGDKYEVIARPKK